MLSSSRHCRQRSSHMTWRLSCCSRWIRGRMCLMLKLSHSISMGDLIDLSCRGCSWTLFLRWRWSTRFKIISSSLYRRKFSICIFSLSGASKIKRNGAPTANYLWFSSSHKSNSHRRYTCSMSANKTSQMTILTFVSMWKRLVATVTLSCSSSSLMPT